MEQEEGLWTGVRRRCELSAGPWSGPGRPLAAPKAPPGGLRAPRTPRATAPSWAVSSACTRAAGSLLSGSQRAGRPRAALAARNGCEEERGLHPFNILVEEGFCALQSVPGRKRRSNTENLSLDGSESHGRIQRELDLFPKPELPPGSDCSGPRPPTFSLPG